MSTPAANSSDTTAPAAGKALTIGLVGLALTAVGLFVSGPAKVAHSYLVGVSYWTAIAIGMLLMC